MSPLLSNSPCCDASQPMLVNLNNSQGSGSAPLPVTSLSHSIQRCFCALSSTLFFSLSFGALTSQLGVVGCRDLRLNASCSLGPKPNAHSRSRRQHAMVLVTKRIFNNYALIEILVISQLYQSTGQQFESFTEAIRSPVLYHFLLCVLVLI